MFKFVLCCTFALATHSILAMPKKPVVQKSVMDDLFDEIVKVRTNVESSIMSIIPDTKNITKLLIASSKEFADSVEKTTKSIRLQVKNAQGIVDNGIKEFTTKLENSANSLKHITDVTVQKTDQLGNIIDTQVKIIFDEIQRALQTNLLYAQANIKKFADSFFNELITAGKTLQLNLTSCQDKPEK